MNENNPPEVPPVEVPSENPVPPPPSSNSGAPVAPVQAINPSPPPLQAPPPATDLVVHGEVSDERILAAERRALDAERRAMELERDNQELKKVPVTPPAPVKKVKRTPGWTDPVFSNDENE
jgi:hypothetical protein